MNTNSHDDRLREEQRLLVALQGASTVLSFESEDDPPDKYTLTFRGKGIARDASAQQEVRLIDLHQVELRLSFSYPDVPPDIRWLSPILHPNISFSGFLNLADIGITWTPDLRLEIVVEKLWDVARAGYLNYDKVTNFSAKNWFEKENQFTLPVDSRPLRDKLQGNASNIVRYERHTPKNLALAGISGGEILFIDETTAAAPPLPPRRTVRQGGDEVFYIGPEN